MQTDNKLECFFALMFTNNEVFLVLQKNKCSFDLSDNYNQLNLRDNAGEMYCILFVCPWKKQAKGTALGHAVST